MVEGIFYVNQLIKALSYEMPQVHKNILWNKRDTRFSMFLEIFNPYEHVLASLKIDDVLLNR